MNARRRPPSLPTLADLQAMDTEALRDWGQRIAIHSAILAVEAGRRADAIEAEAQDVFAAFAGANPQVGAA